MLRSKKSAFGKRPSRKKSTLPAKRTTRSIQCLNWFTSQNLCYWKKNNTRNERRNGTNVFAFIVWHEARIRNGMNDQMTQFHLTCPPDLGYLKYHVQTNGYTASRWLEQQKQLRRRSRTLRGAYKSLGIIMQVFASALPATDLLEIPPHSLAFFAACQRSVVSKEYSIFFASHWNRCRFMAVRWIWCQLWSNFGSAGDWTLFFCFVCTRTAGAFHVMQLMNFAVVKPTSTHRKTSSMFSQWMSSVTMVAVTVPFDKKKKTIVENRTCEWRVAFGQTTSSLIQWKNKQFATKLCFICRCCELVARPKTNDYTNA